MKAALRAYGATRIASAAATMTTVAIAHQTRRGSIPPIIEDREARDVGAAPSK